MTNKELIEKMPRLAHHRKKKGQALRKAKANEKAARYHEDMIRVLTRANEVVDGIAIARSERGICAPGKDIGRWASVYPNANTNKDRSKDGEWGLKTFQQTNPWQRAKETFRGSKWPSYKAAYAAAEAWVLHGTINPLALLLNEPEDYRG